MKPLPLRVRNPSPRFLTKFPVCTGVPLVQGECSSVDDLVVTKNGLPIECQVTPLTYWPCGSLRWVLVECFVDVDASSEVDLSLENRTMLVVSDKSQAVLFTATSAFSSAIELNSQRCGSAVPSLKCNGLVLDLFALMDVELADLDDRIYKFKKEGETKSQIRVHRSTFQSKGTFVDDCGFSVLNLSVRIDAYSKLSQFKVAFTIHNEKAAHHKGGFWDLGDQGSFLFKEFAIVIRGCDDSSLRWSSTTQEWREAGTSTFQVSQFCSGGVFQGNSNHVNAQNFVPETTEGYTIQLDGEILERGPRISPRIEMTIGSGTWCFYLGNFWENHPKKITKKKDLLKFGLFPGEYPDVFELQGGEKKTHTLYIGPSRNSLDWVDSGATVSLSAASRTRANVLPYDEESLNDAAMDSLIEQGIVGANNFFIKREKIDEYGWRNFGDVYADHETWLHNPAEPFISHYNNQYDLIYGFLRMYMLSSKPEWFLLARDLAEHVIEIDIYDTQEDREEYNRGLFWHTNHYLPARTSTHRSYSKLNKLGSEEPQGGGPGGEHCYTTGLKLYYLMTGSEQARSAVLGLANWVRHFYDGNGTLLEVFQRLVRSRLSVLIGTLRNSSVTRHRYPVHRGIGNLVIAQLDAFEITSDRSYLDKAESVISGAIGPRDDLVKRGLREVEENWFYSIFLQSIIRYLDLKRSMNEFDSLFFYARDSLLHYAEWIVSYEQPYLERRDELEYPNHTWVAQDIRRCAILLDAYRYAVSERDDYLERSRFFASYVTKELKDEPTNYYTRILAILMQNHGASAVALAKPKPKRHNIPATVPYGADLHTPHTFVSLLAEELAIVGSALKRFSLKSELNWLRVRFSR